MTAQGLPSGGQGWDKAYRSMADAQNSAYSDAAFSAMQFGQQAQNQDFMQDQARSALANSLLQSRWNTDLGYHNINKNYELGMNRLGEDARQFDDTTDFNYWDRDNFYNLAYDRMDRDDVKWMSDMERDSWETQNQYNMGSDLIKQFLQRGVDLDALCADVARRADYATRLLLVECLLEVALADGHMHPAEQAVFDRVTGLLGIAAPDLDGLRARSDGGGDYAVLGVAPGAGLDEVKGAYRDMVKKYHPDRVAHLGDEFKELAHRKFVEVQQAYERIRSSRGWA